MSRENAALIQSLYDAFARGDAAAVLGVMDPGIVWMEAEGVPYAEGNPYVGPQRVAVGVFTRLMTEWDGFSVRPERIVAEAEAVAAFGRYGGTFRANGRTLDAQFCHLWTVRGGKVTAFQQYTDTAQFQRAQRVELPPLLA